MPSRILTASLRAGLSHRPRKSIVDVRDSFIDFLFALKAKHNRAMQAYLISVSAMSAPMLRIGIGIAVAVAIAIDF